jgi:hypothetical protein
MAKGKNQFVVPTKGGWGVKGEGNRSLRLGAYFFPIKPRIPQNCGIHSWWAFFLLFSHKKVRKRFKVNEDFVAEPLTFEFGFLP